MLGRVAHSTQLYFSWPTRHAYHHTQWRWEESLTWVNFLYQAAHHLLTRIEVGNDTITQRADDAYLIIRLFVHALGLFTHSHHFFAMRVERYDWRLIHRYFAISDNNGVGRAEVDSQFLCKRKESWKKSHFISCVSLLDNKSRQTFFFTFQTMREWLYRNDCSRQKHV